MCTSSALTRLCRIVACQLLVFLLMWSTFRSVFNATLTRVNSHAPRGFLPPKETIALDCTWCSCDGVKCDSRQNTSAGDLHKNTGIRKFDVGEKDMSSETRIQTTTFTVIFSLTKNSSPNSRPKMHITVFVINIVFCSMLKMTIIMQGKVWIYEALTVTIQPKKIVANIFQSTAFLLPATHPTAAVAPQMQWVVLTGMPNLEKRSTCTCVAFYSQALRGWRSKHLCLHACMPLALNHMYAEASNFCLHPVCDLMQTCNTKEYSGMWGFQMYVCMHTHWQSIQDIKKLTVNMDPMDMQNPLAGEWYVKPCPRARMMLCPYWSKRLSDIMTVYLHAIMRIPRWQYFCQQQHKLT